MIDKDNLKDIDIMLKSDNSIPQGWECPKCHRINSPYIQTCPCSLESNTTQYPYECKYPNDFEYPNSIPPTHTYDHNSSTPNAPIPNLAGTYTQNDFSKTTDEQNPFGFPETEDLVEIKHPYISPNKIIEDLKLQIAELQKELDYKKQNELEILEIIKTQESFESLYDKYSGTTKEDALEALKKCAEEADNIIKNLLFELHTVKESEKVEAYEADKMRIKNQELKLKIRNLQGKIRYLENMIRYNSRNNSDNKTQIKQK